MKHVGLGKGLWMESMQMFPVVITTSWKDFKKCIKMASYDNERMNIVMESREMRESREKEIDGAERGPANSLACC